MHNHVLIFNKLGMFENKNKNGPYVGSTTSSRRKDRKYQVSLVFPIYTIKSGVLFVLFCLFIYL